MRLRRYPATLYRWHRGEQRERKVWVVCLVDARFPPRKLFSHRRFGASNPTQGEEG